ncbi:hypothetical protein BZA05DRAFT_416945 [Tricharina praecox]|uniref:uncharacterized protein n=1 Tax=Tricharina praecox TaxID=43433 RepID=UPI00221F3376|nr:uncharacterized protein BZA05DRAFT_416945 [Tricharina praecox]KAI5855367.1 hypothetical protein BZA05DRAFT_416945 [Tricharina praecox]
MLRFLWPCSSTGPVSTAGNFGNLPSAPSAFGLREHSPHDPDPKPPPGRNACIVVSPSSDLNPQCNAPMHLDDHSHLDDHRYHQHNHQHNHQRHHHRRRRRSVNAAKPVGPATPDSRLQTPDSNSKRRTGTSPPTGRVHSALSHRAITYVTGHTLIDTRTATDSHGQPSAFGAHIDIDIDIVAGRGARFRHPVDL